MRALLAALVLLLPLALPLAGADATPACEQRTTPAAPGELATTSGTYCTVTFTASGATTFQWYNDTTTTFAAGPVVDQERTLVTRTVHADGSWDEERDHSWTLVDGDQSASVDEFQEQAPSFCQAAVFFDVAGASGSESAAPCVDGRVLDALP